MPTQSSVKEKYFWSYVSVMTDLDISRRTLQRWINDMDIEPLEFEEHLRVFLTLPNVQRLREYKRFMQTRDQILINRYRDAIKTGNSARITRLKKHLPESA
mgnify:FL=1